MHGHDDPQTHAPPAQLDDAQLAPGDTIVGSGLEQTQSEPLALDALIARLDGAPSNIDELYSAFLARTSEAGGPRAGAKSEETIDAFVEDLYEKSVIDKKAFLRAHMTADIELGEDLPASGEERYREVGYVDEGGIGVIQVARDLELRRKVAVKRLKPSSRTHATTVRRFIHEAQVTAQLDHPHIVPVYSLHRHVEDGGESHAFAMKLIDGCTLKELIQEAASVPDACGASLRSRLDLFIKVCDAISYAHNRGVLHRDLKPANIMVGKFGEVYVMDWGIARLSAALSRAEQTRAPHTASQPPRDPVPVGASGTASDLTQAGEMVGTPLYMSPEQARGEHAELDGRSDLYSLGLILYELACLHQARQGEHWLEVVLNARKGVLSKAEANLARVPADLRAIILRATALEPAGRYRHVDELAADVRRFLAADEVVARPDNSVRRLLRAMGRHRELTLAVILVLVVLSAGVTIWSMRAREIAAQVARGREAAITSWLNEVSAQAAAVDRSSLRQELLVDHLARTATLLLSRPSTDTDAVFYLQSDIQAGTHVPPDWAASPFYGSKVSIQYPVVHLAQGVSRDAVEEENRRLAPLAKAMRHTLLYPVGLSIASSTDEQWQALAVHGSPISWAYLGLESGTMVNFPAETQYEAAYDPRKRPWYRTAVENDGLVWREPYLDVLGQGLMLPTVVALRDAAGKLLGVAAVESPLNDVIDRHLSRWKRDDVLDVFLLDADGGVVVQASLYDSSALEGEFEPQTFPVAAVVEAVRAGQSGFVEVMGPNGGDLIAFQHLSTLEWTYVEEVRLADIVR